MITDDAATQHAPQSGNPVPGAHVVELDVRDDLRNRREPFSRIMMAVESLQSDDVFLLRATFEPVPLFRVLGKRGLQHRAEQQGPDDWCIWFYRADEPVADAPLVSPAAHGAVPAAGPEIHLDVRGLEPPEPMVRTLEALETMPDGYTLVQLNVRVPQFLLPILRERGFDYVIDESQADRVYVRIRRESPAGTSHADSPVAHP